MFVRMLAFHCDQNNSYQVTTNGYRARKINEIRKITIENLPSELRPKITLTLQGGMFCREKLPQVKIFANTHGQN